MPDRYDDIINLPHPDPKNHPRMSRQNRAAQFAPFAALTGYGDAIEEAARLTDARIELTEAEQNALGEQIERLKARLRERPAVTITFFRPDSRKQGGEYLSVTGRIAKIRDFEQNILMEDGKVIGFEDILEIEEVLI